MNILLVAHERNLGGASKSLVTLATELRNRGHKIIVVLPFRSGQVYQKLTRLQISVFHFLPKRMICHTTMTRSEYSGYMHAVHSYIRRYSGSSTVIGKTIMVDKSETARSFRQKTGGLSMKLFCLRHRLKS